MDIKTYNAGLEAERVCPDCPMHGRGTFVGADSSTGMAEIQPLLFLGLNPGTEEARLGLPFVGPSGQFLRRCLAECGISRWAMANSLLCSSANENAIKQADKARAACHDNLAHIFRTFRPLLIAPCGNGAWSLFKTGMPITKAAEHYFFSKGPTGKSAPVLVLPMFHPSALIRSGGANSPKFKIFLDRLQNLKNVCYYASQNGILKTIAWLNDNGKTVLPCFEGK